jgi:hypothetical protein
MNKQSFQVPDLKTVDTVEGRNLRLQNLDKLIDQRVDSVYDLNATFTFKAGWFRTKTIEYKIDYGHPIVSNLSKVWLNDIRFKKIDAGDFDIYVNSFEKYLKDTWNVNLFRTVTPKEYHPFILHRLSELGIPVSAPCDRGIIPDYKDFSLFIELKEKEVPRFQRIKFCLLKTMSGSF